MCHRWSGGPPENILKRLFNFTSSILLTALNCIKNIMWRHILFIKKIFDAYIIVNVDVDDTNYA